MALWEVTFRNQYDYPFLALSNKLPGTALSMWCIWNRELLQVPTRDPAVLKEVEKTIRDAGHVVDEWVDARGGRIFLLECTCGRHHSMWNVFDEHQCLDSPPAVFLDGWAYHRFLSFDPERTRTLFKDLRALGPTELLQKRELPLHVLPSSIWAGSLFGDLTGRQVDAVLRVYRAGVLLEPPFDHDRRPRSRARPQPLHVRGAPAEGREPARSTPSSRTSSCTPPPTDLPTRWRRGDCRWRPPSGDRRAPRERPRSPSGASGTAAERPWPARPGRGS